MKIALVWMKSKNQAVHIHSMYIYSIEYWVNSCLNIAMEIFCWLYYTILHNTYQCECPGRSFRGCFSILRSHKRIPNSSSAVAYNVQDICN
jgi:hypothetical protein